MPLRSSRWPAGDMRTPVVLRVVGRCSRPASRRGCARPVLPAGSSLCTVGKGTRTLRDGTLARAQVSAAVECE